MFENMRFVILFDIFLDTSFKMTCFATAALQLAQVITLGFTLASCSLCDSDETWRYLKTKIEEYVKKVDRFY